MNTIQNIGEKIRILRLQKGMSQEQLALQSGTNISYLGQIERGEKNPTIKTLEKIAAGLETSIGNLIVSNTGTSLSKQKTSPGSESKNGLTPNARKSQMQRRFLEKRLQNWTTIVLSFHNENSNSPTSCWIGLITLLKARSRERLGKVMR